MEDNATHNGGTLKYVRVEYAGHHSKQRRNGFSFYSVGSGTTRNLVSYKVMMMVMNFTVEL
jgi:hypothetical protein